MSVYNPGTWNYDATQLATSQLYAIRNEVSDTDSQNWLLSDQEILYAASQERNFWAACARCAEIIARSFLRKQDVKLGRSLAIAYATAANQYFAMAQTLRRKSLGTVIPYTGAMTKTSKYLYQIDTELIQGAFARQMQENPWTGGYSPDTLGPYIGDNDDAGYEFE